MTSSATEKTLIVLLNGERIGVVEQNPHGQLSFTYSREYQGRAGATPLSLSMPLARKSHPNKVIEPFLRGLLPDNEAVLRRWGVQGGVPWNSPFAQLRHVGEDVAGAAQFVHESRLEAASAVGPIEWVDETYIAGRLRTLRGDRSAWEDIRSPGQFSLAGAQAKFALYRDTEGAWGLPGGRSATTHIIKPPLEYLAHQEVNEHLCLQVAGRLGLPAAASEIMDFHGEPAVVLRRYDRIVQADGSVLRVHQEDFCQALSVYPARKYQREDGGPGAADVISVLRTHMPPSLARAAIEVFWRALAFNWVILGPDAHAKNYSLLLSGRQVRLAPLYDISSVAPYPDRYDLQGMAMAMSINGKYRNQLVIGDDWRALAVATGVDQAEAVEWVREIVSGAPDAFSDVVSSEPAWVQKLGMTRSLLATVAAHSVDFLRRL